MDYKSLTPADLDAIFAGIQFKTRPMQHQRVCLAFAMDGRDRDAFWLDIGTGKTLTALYATQLWACKRILVVCPPSVIRTWEEQIREHTDRTFIRLEGSRDARRKLLFESGAEISIVNYEGLKVVFGNYVAYKKHNRKTKKTVTAHKFVRDQSMIEAVKWDCIIWDEIHHLRSPESLAWEISQYLSAQTNHAIGLTGTPLTASLRELWPEYAVIDLGVSLGQSFHTFTTDYFNEKVGYGRAGVRYPVYEIKPGADKEIIERVADITLRYDKSECVDLPPKVYERRYVTLSPDQWKAMDMVMGELKQQLDSGDLDLGNVGNRASKLAQITDGFIYAEKGAFRFKVNPKLNELLAMLCEVTSKVIVYHSFVESGRIIEDGLIKAGIMYRSLRGEIKNKDRQVLDFKELPGVKVLVAHWDSGGEGQNLQVANCTCFYSQTYNGSVTREQCEGRTWRVGQKSSTAFVDFLAEGTIDERIYEIATGRITRSDWILDFIKNYKPRS